MVRLNPVLSCVMAVEEGVSRGDSVRDALLSWAELETQQDRSGIHSFEHEVLQFLREAESGVRSSVSSETIFRQSLFTILLSGLSGHAILPALRELRTDIEGQLELDMKAHVEGLPLKMLVPLLMFMFPAFLILLLGPITQKFMESLR